MRCIFESLRATELHVVRSLSQDVHGLISLVQLSACGTLALVSGRITHPYMRDSMRPERVGFNIESIE